MGISGLLPLLKSIQTPCKLQKFAGQTIGVDAYGWLHRGTVACAIDLALGKPTRKYVDFSMHRVRMLIHFGVIPYLVFDGDYLPSKAATEVDRSKRRSESKRKGLELYQMNKPSQAHLELQKAVEVTPAMARELIEELKRANVAYVVAPYEADAQLVYLERQGLIQGIISEDSDLLVFGAKRLLTKLDQFGDCVEINRSNFAACTAISLADWSDEEFRCMAILSGCDYLASISGMGLKNAYRLVRKYKDIEKILRMLQFDGKFHVAPGYLDAFRKAELTFQYQRVFCPTKKKMVTLTEMQDDLQEDDLDFVGPQTEHHIAAAVATGDLDPMTKTPIIRLKQAQPPVHPSRRRVTAKENGVPLTAVKGNQSLDDFFKSKKRTPLAELDPNQFTPSPSQQRILRQAAGSDWESSPVPSETPSRMTDAPSNLYSSAARLSGGSGQNIASTMAPMSSAKRRRLLDEVEQQSPCSPTKDTQHERSHFFSTKDQSTNARSRSGIKTKPTRPKNFEIWSDETKPTTISGSLEQLEKQIYPGDDKVKSSVGNTKDTGVARTLRQSLGSSSSSIEKSDSSAGTSDLEVTVQLPSLDGRQNSNASMSSQSVVPCESEVTPATVTERDESIQSRPPGLGQRSSTPLQRIGAGALYRSSSSSRALHHTARSRLERSTSNIMKSRPPTPCLPLNRSIGPDASRGKGSEDFIIPDSDEESEEVLCNDTQLSGKSIDLGRFVYPG